MLDSEARKDRRRIAEGKFEVLIGSVQSLHPREARDTFIFRGEAPPPASRPAGLDADRCSPIGPVRRLAGRLAGLRYHARELFEVKAHRAVDVCLPAVISKVPRAGTKCPGLVPVGHSFLTCAYLPVPPAVHTWP